MQKERTGIAIHWPSSIAEAKAIQETIKDRVKLIPLEEEPHFIAGVDASFSDGKVIGVACLYSYPQIAYIEHAFALRNAIFPYVPGYLTFREGPAIVDALNNLKTAPQLILVDGQGIAHPRGAGIASHLGVLLDIPSIGCAKSRLIGEHEEPKSVKGDWTVLRHNGQVVGAVLRTREGVRPLFVSPGYRIDLNTAINIILTSVKGYRIPEPLRKADSISKMIKKEIQ